MKRCSLLLLTLAIVSCAPPYSAELNASAGLAGQMILLSTLGPVDSPDRDSTTAIKFLPIKPTAASLDQVSSTSGFLVSESSGSESLSFAFQDSSGKVQTMGGVGSFSLAGADPNYPLYQYDVIATTTTANILVFHSQAFLNDVQLFTAAPNGSIQNATSTAQTLVSVFTGATAVFGAHVFPTSTGADNFNFIFLVGSITEGTTSLGTPPTNVFASGSTANTVPLPNVGNRILYYRNQSNSVASYLDPSGHWVCYRWDQALLTPSLLAGVTHPVSALLTSGDLISTDGGTLRVYDPISGTQVSSVDLGGMQFCYEAYVGSTPYVFFSLTLGFPHNSWIFRVYAIPTSKLRGLKG